jgi:hypothetical protein
VIDDAAVARSVGQLALPVAVGEQGALDLVGGGQLGVQQLVDDAAERGGAAVAVDALGAAVPVGDGAVEVADDDGVVGEVEELGLLAQGGGLGGDLTLAAVLLGAVGGDADDHGDGAVLVVERRHHGLHVATVDLGGVAEHLAGEGGLEGGAGLGLVGVHRQEVDADQLTRLASGVAQVGALREHDRPAGVDRPAHRVHLIEDSPYSLSIVVHTGLHHAYPS